ncbi:histidine phosphatase family protein [Blastococcus aggregatus]|uniref:histidine phosphatase family protein n=1 Tax=Blastococcus aggregatus TaxID=38502 RepID=UPI000BE44EF1|nr:histidine phosphatase family protein [Blastococcus aggregatus]
MTSASTDRRARVPGTVFDDRVGKIIGGRAGQIIVLRHGQTDWSRSGKHTGHTDLPLLTEGEEQARALRDGVGARPFAAVWTSPLQRAARTAELAGLQITGTDRDLVEVDYGGHEGRTTAEISAELGRTWSIWADGTVPGETPGETLDQVATRVDRVLDRARARLDDGDVALVAHGHVLRILTARWLGLAPEAGALFALPPAAYGVLGHEHDRPVLTGWGLR